MFKIKVFIIVPAIFILSVSCSDRNLILISDSYPGLEVAIHVPQGFIELSLGQLPNNGANIEAAEKYIEPLDSDSIEMFFYRGGIYYHPVSLSHRCFLFLGTYYKTGEKKYLDRAEKYAQKLMSECITIDGAAYAPYMFRYAVHSDSVNTLEQPWYSGMAQGELLSVLVRLFEFTGKKEYLSFSHKLFQSFTKLRRDHKDWVVRIDSSSYYWIEEYPHDENPGQTLNGFIASVFGVYDYYRVTKNPRAKFVYDLSLTTIKHYITAFRREGKTSYYCLGHKHLATESYHNFHISLLYNLNRMTGDQYFLDRAHDFEVDANVAFGSGM